jgi:hypothetical protein
MGLQQKAPQYTCFYVDGQLDSSEWDEEDSPERPGGGSAGGSDPPGSGGQILVKPKVPAGNNYTQPQLTARSNGLNNALTHADQVDCAHLYAPGDEDPVSMATQTLENTTYRLLVLPDDHGNPAPGTGAATLDRSNVIINTIGAYFNAVPSANGTVTVRMPNQNGVPDTYTFSNTATFQAFILLHELGHQFGVFGPDVDPAGNGANSQAVLTNCFHQDAQGVFH